MNKHKKMKIEQHLKAHFCTDDPFRLYMDKIHNDGRNVVATNGRILAHIDRDLDIGSEVPSFPNWKKVMPEASVDVFTMPIDALFTPADQINDRAPTSTPCEACDGEGVFDHDCDCELCREDYEDCMECGGMGSVDGQKEFLSYIKIGSHYYRASYINQILGLFKMFEAETCSLMEYKSGLYLSIEGVVCLCMYVMVNEHDFEQHGDNHDFPYEIIREVKIGDTTHKEAV